MANAVFPKALENLMKGSVDLVNGTVKVMMVDSADYSYDAADEFMADVAAAAQVAASAALTNKTVVGGVFDADDAVWSAVTGDSVEAVIVYLDTGLAATDILLCWFDTFDAGMPFIPQGNGYTLSWNAAGIFSI